MVFDDDEHPDASILNKQGYLFVYRELVPYLRKITNADKGKMILLINATWVNKGAVDYSYTNKWLKLVEVLTEPKVMTFYEESYALEGTRKVKRVTHWVVNDDLPIELQLKYAPNKLGYVMNGGVQKLTTKSAKEWREKRIQEGSDDFCRGLDFVTRNGWMKPEHK